MSETFKEAHEVFVALRRLHEDALSRGMVKLADAYDDARFWAGVRAEKLWAAEQEKEKEGKP